MRAEMIYTVNSKGKYSLISLAFLLSGKYKAGVGTVISDSEMEALCISLIVKI